MQTPSTPVGHQLHRDGVKSRLATQVTASPPEAALPQPGHAARTGDAAFRSPAASPEKGKTAFFYTVTSAGSDA